jgi:5-(carboxyamino)imidazole ribonucleotide synthase
MNKQTIGILGNGQLGRMLTQVAIQYGHNVICFGPSGSNSPSALAGATPFSYDYDQFSELEKFIQSGDLFTFEFENIPEKTLLKLKELTVGTSKKIYPSPDSIALTQNRIREKSLAISLGISTSLAHHSELNSNYELKKPMILKSAKFGYDGKGQFKVHDKISFENAIQECKDLGWVLENIIDFDYEISIISVRYPSGKILFYPPCFNTHKNHILDTTFCPYPLQNDLKNKIYLDSERYLHELNYVGVSAIEYFIKGDEYYFNEIAPRPHNSGHFSQNCGSYSQFELQLFSLVGIEISTLPEIQPTVMKNLIGEDVNTIPDRLVKDSNQYPPFHLHLYQKNESRPGRKMGHINFHCSWEDFPKELKF